MLIRRELPRTTNAGWQRSLPHRDVEGSPFRVPLDCCPFDFPLISCFIVSLASSLLLLFPLSEGVAVGFGVAVGVAFKIVHFTPVLANPEADSTFIPMAQMKPNNSRATAVTTSPWCFPLNINRQ